MSPEQAKGKAVDKRADIWAFDAFCTSVLPASLPFEGETVTEVLASILKGEPDWKALPPPRHGICRSYCVECFQKETRPPS